MRRSYVPVRKIAAAIREIPLIMENTTPALRDASIRFRGAFLDCLVWWSVKRMVEFYRVQPVFATWQMVLWEHLRKRSMTALC